MTPWISRVSVNPYPEQLRCERLWVGCWNSRPVRYPCGTLVQAAWTLQRSGMSRSHDLWEVPEGSAQTSSKSAPSHVRSMEVLTPPNHSLCSGWSVGPIDRLHIMHRNYLAKSLFLNEDMVLRIDSCEWRAKLMNMGKISLHLPIVFLLGFHMGNSEFHIRNIISNTMCDRSWEVWQDGLNWLSIKSSHNLLKSQRCIN